MAELLFNPKPDKIIDAFDLFGKKQKRNLINFNFRVSVYGMLFEGSKLLVQRHPKLVAFGLPGGGVEIDENLNAALIREFKEETGLEVIVGELITVTEDYFTFEEEDAHTILITYEVKRKGGKLIPEGNNQDTGEVKYMELANLKENNTQRVFWPIIQKIINTK